MPHWTDDLLFKEEKDWVSLSSRYPWYATARLGSLLQQPDDKETARMAALVLDNPAKATWWLAQQTKVGVLPVEQPIPIEVTPEIAAADTAPEEVMPPEQPIPASLQETAESPVLAPTTDELPSDEEVITEPMVQELAVEAPVIDQPEALQPVTDPIDLPTTDELPAAAEVIVEASTQDPAIEAPIIDQPEALQPPVAEPIDLPIADELPTAAEVIAEPIAQEPALEVPVIDQPEALQPVTEAVDLPAADDEVGVADDSIAALAPTEIPEVQDHQVADRLGSTLQQALEAMKAPVTQQAQDLPAFQPHHTIDYFEAVGIRFRDVAQKDKLYGQVKTFTQWLRAMKQIDYKTGEVAEDKAVSSNAAASLQPQQIFTETMAEVLLQQGRKLEAAAIFTHLQVLHPDKSAYFAARLNDLKST